MVYYKTKYSAKGSSLSSSNYRFGYQGSEKDNEVNSSNGTSYTTEFRQLDTRLGRWFSSDPVFQPWQSSYTSMDNNPVNLTDVEGLATNDGGKPNIFRKAWNALTNKTSRGQQKKRVGAETNDKEPSSPSLLKKAARWLGSLLESGVDNLNFDNTNNIEGDNLKDITNFLSQNINRLPPDPCPEFAKGSKIGIGFKISFQKLIGGIRKLRNNFSVPRWIYSRTVTEEQWQLVTNIPFQQPAPGMPLNVNVNLGNNLGVNQIVYDTFFAPDMVVVTDLNNGNMTTVDQGVVGTGGARVFNLPQGTNNINLSVTPMGNQSSSVYNVLVQNVQTNVYRQTTIRLFGIIISNNIVRLGLQTSANRINNRSTTRTPIPVNNRLFNLWNSLPRARQVTIGQ